MNKELIGYKALGKLFGAALKMKRPLVLKVSGMADKIPDEALESERKVLYAHRHTAFLHQSLQETMKYYSKVLEGYYDELKKARKMKKDRKSPESFANVDYEKSDGYKNVYKTNSKELINFYKEDIEKLKFSDSNETALKSVSDLINNYKNLTADKKVDDDILDEYILEFKKASVNCKEIALEQREQKIKQKDTFKQYLKQVNEGLKLDKKLGKILKGDNGEYELEKPENFDKWKKYEESNKITNERKYRISSLKQPTE